MILLSEILYQLNDVYYNYALSRKQFTKALQGVNLTICKGEAVTVVGPSGCGKSTLLALLSGLTMPTAGEILFEGKRLNGINRQAMLILQDYGLFPWKTVAENVALGLHLNRRENRLTKQEITDKTDNILEQLNIAGERDKFPTQLSGGQRQRVAIARALVMEPEVLLMDEPFAALDAVTKASLKDLIKEVCRRRSLTLVFVTHNIEEAADMGDRVVVFGREPGIIREIIDGKTESLVPRIKSALGIGGADDEK